MMSYISDKNPDDLFEILTQLGEGSYGSVWKAMDKRDRSIVAIKIITVENETSSLRKEVDILRKCNSSYIVKYYGAYRKDNEVWIVMEYCGSGSCADLMSICERTLTETEVACILRETLQGLAYLHNLKLIHRDVKAGNILLNHKGQAKLADFGVSAQLAATISKRCTVIGTPYWMAPEVLRENQYDVSADIWSLGITTIEMLAGTPPLSNVHPMRAIFLIPNHKPPTMPNPETSTPEANDFISCCLKKDPCKRSKASELLNHPWIKNAPPRNTLQQMVCIALPKIEEYRQLDKETEEKSSGSWKRAKKSGSGLIAIKTSGSSLNSELDQNTMIINSDIELDSGTMIVKRNSNDQLDTGTIKLLDTGTIRLVESGTIKVGDSGTIKVKNRVDSDPYDSGTIVINTEMSSPLSEQTIIKRGLNIGNINIDCIDQGTIVISEGSSEVTPASLPKRPTGHKRRDSTEVSKSSPEKDTNPKQVECGDLSPKSYHFEMVPEASLVLSKLKIPDTASVKELQIMLMDVNQNHQKKRFALDKWYKKQKNELTCRINKLSE